MQIIVSADAQLERAEQGLDPYEYLRPRHAGQDFITEATLTTDLQGGGDFYEFTRHGRKYRVSTGSATVMTTGRSERALAWLYNFFFGDD